MKCVVYLDRQHSGKPGRKARDRGAGADLDGDGVIGIEEREAMLTARYLLACESALLEMGHTVIPISDGWYSDRHRRINQYAGTFAAGVPQVVIAAHLNAGGGDYGMVLYDHRSRSGPELAARISKQLRMVAPEINGVKCVPAKPDDWTRNAYATIGGLMQPIGICYEPAFMDKDTHQDILTREGLAAIGRSLAAGIDAWAQTQGA
jgi:hypothetical protein